MELQTYDFLPDTPSFAGPTRAFPRLTVEEAKTLLQAVQNGVPEVVATLLQTMDEAQAFEELPQTCLLYTSPSPRD